MLRQKRRGPMPSAGLSATTRRKRVPVPARSAASSSSPATPGNALSGGCAAWRGPATTARQTARRSRGANKGHSPEHAQTSLGTR
ncbi:MAG: hypothetical protein FJ290_26745 [Planctomycetes bacterium]|nr:hypothetical protein [Planctomycetota bacterium]